VSTEPRFLAEIAAELEAMDGADPESDHGRADDLLIEAIRRLASLAPELARPEAERVVAAFWDVPKWYA
jgi:hypothetical protein